MTRLGQTNPWRGYIVLSLVWLAAIGGVWFLARRPAAQAIEVLPPPTVAPSVTLRPSPFPTEVPPTPTPSPLRVDVAGAVQAPGVYVLPPGSIVADAIAAAGGPAPGAALDRLNKASALGDGVQVYVPRVNEAGIPTPLTPLLSPSGSTRLQVPGASGTSPDAVYPGGTGASTEPIDINQATVEQLEALPGIGPELARRIIAGRPYGSVDDLDRVSGIGATRLEQIRPYICVR